MYGSRRDTMFEIYRGEDFIIEVPDLLVYSLAFLFVITIFKLASKTKK